MQILLQNNDNTGIVFVFNIINDLLIIVYFIAIIEIQYQLYHNQQEVQEREEQLYQSSIRFNITELFAAAAAA